MGSSVEAFGVSVEAASKHGFFEPFGLKPLGYGTSEWERGLSLALWAGELISALQSEDCRAYELFWGAW